MLKTVLEENHLEAFCTEQTLLRLQAVIDALLEANQTMNLTAICDPHEIAVRHIADSLRIAAYLPQGVRVLDVGCGGGFPCLPLAAARPDLHITALDSTAKKLTFVEATARALGADEAHFCVLCGRAEELGNDPAYRERFDVVCARAVARLNVLSELCIPFVKQGGFFLSMKGSQGQEELVEAERGIKLLGADLQKMEIFDLCGETEPQKRVVLLFQKQTKTPKIYPRAFAQIRKKPL
jgi:16S rRNA (guanine(527)-N(7))-methyltransferase RsmG